MTMNREQWREFRAQKLKEARIKYRKRIAFAWAALVGVVAAITIFGMGIILFVVWYAPENYKVVLSFGMGMLLGQVLWLIVPDMYDDLKIRRWKWESEMRSVGTHYHH